MINTQMRQYNYYTYGAEDAYGQPALSDSVQGNIKMAINFITQTIDTTKIYSGCQYIGLTQSAVTEDYVIQYGSEKLKVKYVNPIGRYKQVYLERI